ncbi:hypothetical protein BST27_08050 [Mycobacterium intermedium]|uniref:Anti-sigma-M factor RsmA n=1 Tax=Mycobacterium intermedium TaxID=28445 RepID=A0A1E3S912_MYCIE|nr:hypothetical protein [Mycobacterium intermedium]MCV6967334.1 hypothetical protein [Mycobacterium intermedium]ODQ98561.1 hypothetical protein BHQ20_21455 [Mycobacterium intermedium]OPE50440.1 hypothetical protein BV508_10120 [Mycobacterium intermedium]ORB08200.1 hypothetical protein BST27_08050 [Mycobacterium intermedium]
MYAAENDADPPPLTVELLADLQAGLLDDDTAARVRRRLRTDPQAQATLHALQQVRSDIADAGADPASAPDPPPGLAARISTALRADGPAHSARPPARPGRVIAGLIGLAAVLAAVGLGTAALLNAPPPEPSTPRSAQLITVSTTPPTIPLTHEQIIDLLNQPPDYGPLGEPARRASCLSGLGYPSSTDVLGAIPVEVNARPGVLLVLAGDSPHELAVFAVAPNCSAADTGLLASTSIPRAPHP